jgi:hypothetical protein
VDSIPLGYTIQVNLGAGIGIVLMIVGAYLFRSARAHLPGLGLILLGDLFMVWGCAAYAKNKGYSEFIGVLGLLGVLGLIILIILPYRSPD